MSFGKSLELRKIKVNETYLGSYIDIPIANGKSAKVRGFSVGDVIHSRDNKTKYLVSKNGSFKRI